MSTLEKSPDAFRTISEVAEDLDLPQHVLRFWETRFSQIKPLKRGGGRRYYRPDDVELLRGIRHLLYGEGYTIKGVQRILKEQGAKFVMQAWRGLPGPLPGAGGDAEAGIEGTAKDDAAAPAAVAPPQPTVAPPAAATPAPAAAATLLDEPLPKGLLAEGEAPAADPNPKGGSFRLLDRFRSDKTEDETADSALTKEDVRRLQSTLFELLECKRVLDQAR